MLKNLFSLKYFIFSFFMKNYFKKVRAKITQYFEKSVMHEKFAQLDYFYFYGLV